MRTTLRKIGTFVVAATACTLLSTTLESRVIRAVASSAQDPLDAVTAAPDSHTVMFENDRVRVLKVQIAPGAKEPAHVHRNSSVMITYRPTRLRYYGATDAIEFESPEGPREASASEPEWMEPEKLHAVENIDTTPYEAYRIELK